MSDQYHKYKLIRQIKGKLSLTVDLHEAVVHALAERISEEDICQFLDVTPDQIKEILADPLAQKRLEYKKRILKPRSQPQTPAERLELATKVLVKLCRSSKSDPKTKISAAKELGSLALDELKLTPTEQKGEVDQETLSKLAEAYSDKDETDS